MLTKQELNQYIYDMEIKVAEKDILSVEKDEEIVSLQQILYAID